MSIKDFGDDPPRICIVDDDEAFISLVEEVLGEALGAEVACHFLELPSSPEDIEECGPELVIVDLQIGGGWRDKPVGVAFVEAMRARPGLAEVPIIVCTGDIRSLEEHGDALRALPDVYALRKPFGVEELEGFAGRLIERRRARGT